MTTLNSGPESQKHPSEMTTLADTSKRRVLLLPHKKAEWLLCASPQQKEHQFRFTLLHNRHTPETPGCIQDVPCRPHPLYHSHNLYPPMIPGDVPRMSPDDHRPKKRCSGAVLNDDDVAIPEDILRLQLPKIIKWPDPERHLSSDTTLQSLWRPGSSDSPSQQGCNDSGRCHAGNLKRFFGAIP